MISATATAGRDGDGDGDGRGLNVKGTLEYASPDTGRVSNISVP